MAREIEIAAAMRSARWDRLGEEVKALEEAGVNVFHFDAGDGQFISDVTGSPEAISAIKKISKIPIELHLMVKDPERVYKKFSEAGVDIFIIHIEANSNIKALLTDIKSLGKKVALTLNPNTPAEAIFELLPLVDKVSIMTVNPGVGGIFVESVLPKISEIVRQIKNDGLATTVQVDGGVSLKTRDVLLGAGVTSFVVGYPIFSRENYSLGVREIRFGKI